MKTRFGSCEFVNELGRTIRLELLRAGDQVTVRMIGPDSTAENVLTPIEAGKLHDGLAFLLQPETPGAA